jgi:predicted aconitase
MRTFLLPRQARSQNALEKKIMNLTPEELSILNGQQGETLQTLMQILVDYGKKHGAVQLVPIEGQPHLEISSGNSRDKAFLHIFKLATSAGLRSLEPFTVNPRPPGFRTMKSGLAGRLSTALTYRQQAAFENQLRALGLKDDHAFTCACYLPETGNIPQRGAALAWSEISAVAFANSVLGARSNRTPAGIDLLCAILGKVPLFGLLTEAGRQAEWKVGIATSRLPDPQILGSAIGMKIGGQIPYIVGLDAHLGPGRSPRADDYLKDLGAAAARHNVMLFHVENITPEAVERRQALLAEHHQTYLVDDNELQGVMDGLPTRQQPKMVLIGCPHLSIHQVAEWVDRIEDALQAAGTSKAALPTYLFTGPDVITVLQQELPEIIERVPRLGIHLSPTCPLLYLETPLASRQHIATNARKLCAEECGQFFPESDLLQTIAAGRLPG